MTEWAASHIWNLMYLAATIGSLCLAYYSRQEQVQRVMAYIAITYVLSMCVINTGVEIPIYLAIDLIGAGFAFRVWWLNRIELSSVLCSALFIAMAILLLFDRSLGGRIAYNLLYLAQLVAISACGYRYGVEARKKTDPRSDPYHRMFKYGRE